MSLAITPERVAIMPAEHLWGGEIPATVAALQEHGSVAAIGPAGENGVLFANIMMGEGNSVGRGGLGAVMGAKGLKAVAVAGDRKTGIADPALFDKARQDVLRLFRASPVVFGPLGIAEFGTPVLVDLMAQRRMAPTANFSRTYFENSGNYSGPAIREACGAKKDGCYGCPIQCKKSDRDGGHLPEYETVSHFGALNNVDDLQAIVRANPSATTWGWTPLPRRPHSRPGGRSRVASRRPRRSPACWKTWPCAGARADCWPWARGDWLKHQGGRSSP